MKPDFSLVILVFLLAVIVVALVRRKV